MRFIVKLGTSTLTAGTPHLHPPRLVELARQLAEAHHAGHQAVLVSSGAMAAGRAALNFPQLPKDIPAKQMLAAVGQPRLMALYEQLFGLYNVTVAQVLLTRADLADRRRYLNARNALLALLNQRVLPIINENDTVATEEIRVGDNDNLSALVATVLEADRLILLTDQTGLFTADPRHHPHAELVREVTSPRIPEALWQAAGGTASGLGTGGMTTKLQAADLARRGGTEVIIADGRAPQVIARLLAGEALGTRFSALSSALEGRKRYILAARKPPGSLSINVGAAHALHQGGSLLPVGIVAVHGRFDRGDPVRVLAESGEELARGLAAYAAPDMARIAGHHSQEIEAVLGYHYGDAAIHRNDLVWLAGTPNADTR